MNAKKLRVMYVSYNRKESVMFYSNILGFKIFEEFDTGTMIDIGCGIIEIFDPKEGRDYTNKISISIQVEDVKSLWNQLKSKVDITHELRNNDWGDTSFGIQDIDKNQIVFFESN